MKSGTEKSVNQEKSQLINRALVIDLLRQEGLCSRAHLAKLSGLKQTTMTNIINEFLKSGLVVEDGTFKGNKGRRFIGVRLNGERFKVIGVMMTRKHFYLSLMGISGQVYTVEKHQFKANDAQMMLSEIKEAIKRVLASDPSSRFVAVGLAMPGPYKPAQGKMVFITQLTGWEKITFRENFEEELGVPVLIENDADAGAYAQIWCSDGARGIQNMVYVIAGQGVGCGIIANGEPLRGNSGIAGEIGHTTIDYSGLRCECGNKGCLEKYCSTIALQENILKRIENGEKSVLKKDFSIEDIRKAVLAGDAVAVQEYHKACDFLGIGLVNIVNQLNPGLIIIGDELTKIDPEQLLSIVRRRIQCTVRPMVWEGLTIKINEMEHNPVLMGAAAMAAQSAILNPMALMQEDPSVTMLEEAPCEILRETARVFTES